MGGRGVRGILLDSSVLFAAGDGGEDAPLRPRAEFLLRKLRYSNIPTGLSYAAGSADAKVAAIERLARLNSFACFVLNPFSFGDSINEVAQAWGDNGGSILHVVSNNSEDLFRTLTNYGVQNIILNAEGGCGSKNSSGLVIKKLEELPLTICRLTKQAIGGNYLVVGYIMKPSREEDFAKRGALPLHPTQNGLMFMPITYELPISSQLKEVDIVIHKATDEIISVQMSSSSEGSNKIIYTSGMQELQRRAEALNHENIFWRCIDQQPDCCIIDQFINIYPVVDRLKIQEVLLCLDNLNTGSHCQIRRPHFLKVENFDDPDLKQNLSEAGLSVPSIVKPQVACGVADAHSMAIVFNVEDYLGLGVPLPAVVQEYVDHSSILFKFYVLGDKIFYAVKKSIPNADILIKLSEASGLKPLLFDSLKSLPTARESQAVDGDGHKVNKEHHLDIGIVTDAANCLRRMLDLTIFGFDVVIQEGTGDHVIVDVNYLPSFKEVPNDDAIPAFWDAIKMKYESRKINR